MVNNRALGKRLKAQRIRALCLDPSLPCSSCLRVVIQDFHCASKNHPAIDVMGLKALTFWDPLHTSDREMAWLALTVSRYS